MSDSLQPHELQHARPPCPSPTPGVHPDSCPSSQWCHPAISSSVVPFSSCPQSLPASESFPMSHLFSWGGQSTGVSASASFLPKKSQGWSPSEWTGWISFLSVRLFVLCVCASVHLYHFSRFHMYALIYDIYFSFSEFTLLRMTVSRFTHVSNYVSLLLVIYNLQHFTIASKESDKWDRCALDYAEN